MVSDKRTKNVWRITLAAEKYTSMKLKKHGQDSPYWPGKPPIFVISLQYGLKMADKEETAPGLAGCPGRAITVVLQKEN